MILVITTADDRAQLEALADHLVATRLAACCQIEGPITSVYRWQGAIEKATEYRCWIKASDDRYDELESAILERHPYEQPQLIALPIEQAAPGYRHWVESQCRPSTDNDRPDQSD